MPPPTDSFPRLFVTDLDGTLLGGGFEPYARLPEPVCALLDELDARGCAWAINTTWDPPGQWAMVEDSPLRARPKYLIGEMGHRLVEAAGGALRPVEPYSGQTRAALVRAREEHLFPFMRDVTARFDHARIRFYGHWFEMEAIAEDAARFRAYAEEQRRSATGLTLRVKPGENRLVAYPAFLNKGRALRAVLEREGLSPADVVVAGDEVADLAMMAPDCTRFPICPANAHPRVKEAVRRAGGAAGSGHSGAGVVEAFRAIEKK